MTNYLAPLPKEQEVRAGGVSIMLHLVENGVWLLTDIQVARAYGIEPGTVRQHLPKSFVGRGVAQNSKRFICPARLEPNRVFLHLTIYTVRAGLLQSL